MPRTFFVRLEKRDSLPHISEAAEAKRGEMLAEVLMLKKKRSNGRFDTIWGDKTALGLYRTVERIMQGVNDDT